MRASPDRASNIREGEQTLARCANPGIASKPYQGKETLIDNGEEFGGGMPAKPRLVLQAMENLHTNSDDH